MNAILQTERSTSRRKGSVRRQMNKRSVCVRWVGAYVVLVGARMENIVIKGRIVSDQILHPVKFGMSLQELIRHVSQWQG